MELIRDLEGIDKVTPEWVEAFEDYIPKWLESLVPHYEVAKKYDVDILSLTNTLYYGDEPECIEENGVHYYLSESSLFGKELSFNGSQDYYPVNWEERLEKVYVAPEEPYGCNTIMDSFHFHRYTVRYQNRKAPNNELRNRIEKRFQELVGDDTVLFDFGSTSYILLNPEKQKAINYHKLTVA